MGRLQDNAVDFVVVFYTAADSHLCEDIVEFIFLGGRLVRDLAVRGW